MPAELEGETEAGKVAAVGSAVAMVTGIVAAQGWLIEADKQSPEEWQRCRAMD